MTRNTAIGVLLAVVVATSLLAAPVVATDSSISADPDEANAPSTHTVTANVGPSINDSSLTGLNVDYSATSQNGDVADVGESDIEEMYIERATGERTDVSDDISSVGSSNNGETLTIRLSGDYTVFEGDHVVVTYSGVENPDAGEYEIVFTLNPQSSGTQSSDTLSISENTSSTGTPTDGPTPTPTFEDDDTPTPTGDEGVDGDGDTATPTDEGTDDGDTATPTDESMDGDDTPTVTEAETNGSDTATDGKAGGDGANGSEADDGGGGSSGDGAGFGVGLAVAALLGAVLLARRR